MSDTASARNREDIVTHLVYAAPGGFIRRPVTIRDARAMEAAPSLEREGFALRSHVTGVENFFDSAEVRTVFYPEMEQMLREATGAVRALAFEHDVRCASTELRRSRGAREPVRVVHDDYTAKSARERVRLYLGEEAERLLREPYGVINVWRPLVGPVRDTPLAVCDARTIDEADLVPSEQGVKHEVYLVNFSTRHRWYYFSAMTPDEALLLKCFDSRPDGRARLTAHSAFDVAAESPAVPARQSIEVRALVFFAPTSAAQSAGN